MLDWKNWLKKIPVSVRSDDNNYDCIEIVHKCKNKTYTDYNDIYMRIVKHVILGIAKPHTHICNLSFKTGKFPRKMKIAKVIPLYKTGHKHHFTNYRPVSLLPQFSKILENLVAARLNKFINKHNLLTDSHYRFRPNRFTSLAVIELVEKNHSKILRPKELCSWFHSLINKLEWYGISGVMLNWRRSYLHNRQQFVKMGEYMPSCLDIACGAIFRKRLKTHRFRVHLDSA